MITTLPDELLQAQLDSVELLLAMYAAEDEISLGSSSSRLLDSLRAHLMYEDHACAWIPEEPDIVLRLAVPIWHPQGTSMTLFLMIAIPLVQAEEVHLTDPPPARLSVERTSFLTRKALQDLIAGMPCHGNEGIFETFEYLQSTATLLLKEDCTSQTSSSVSEQDTVLTRVWFYLPSLSTREKRDDMVSVAPTYGLTGFVLAGKPGVLCVEGKAADVQAYLADIKRNSWGDIPSFQKKISERFREENIKARKFHDMREITDDIERHGQRCNRSNLAQVEEFLKAAGLPEAFGKVFMQRA